MAKKTIGITGVGRMGQSMAEHRVARGFPEPLDARRMKANDQPRGTRK